MKLYLTAFKELYLLNKRIFNKNVLFFAGLLLLFCFFDARALNIDLLNGYDVDEFYFVRIMYSRQFYGFNHADPQKFFSGFYSYGRLFWVINFIINYIPFSFGKYDAALFISRLLSSVFAIQTLLIFKEILRRFNDHKLWIAITTTIALLMAYFWAVGSWIHPDWIMMFFIMMAFYYFFESPLEKKQHSANFLLALALAIAIKVHTLQLLPLLLLFNFKEFLLQPSVTALKSSIKNFLISGVVILILFVLLNPYLLHPKGPGLFYESFSKDMNSNKNNYWSSYIPTYTEKFNAYTGSYLSAGITLLTGLCICIFTYHKIRNLRKHFEQFAFIVSWLVIAAYYLLFVNKTWPHYYLPVALMSLIALYFTIASFHLKAGVKNVVWGIALLLQIINVWMHRDVLIKWAYPQHQLAANHSYTLNNDIARFLNQQPDSRNAHIAFTYLLPIPLNAAHLNLNNVFHIATIDEEILRQIGKLAPFPPDYLIVQKSMYYNALNKSSGPDNDKPAALLDAIKQNKLPNYKLVDSTRELLYIKRVK